LKRDVQVLIDAGGEPRLIGNRLMKHLHEVFHHWHRYLEGKIQWATMQRNILTVYYPLWETLEVRQQSAHAPDGTHQNIDVSPIQMKDLA